MKRPALWLFLLYLKDVRSRCGRQFREDPPHLDSSKPDIAHHTTGNLTLD